MKIGNQGEHSTYPYLRFLKNPPELELKVHGRGNEYFLEIRCGLLNKRDVDMLGVDNKEAEGLLMS